MRDIWKLKMKSLMFYSIAGISGLAFVLTLLIALNNHIEPLTCYAWLVSSLMLTTTALYFAAKCEIEINQKEPTS